MVKVTVSPSTLPSVMVDLPVNELVVSPVTLLPSCLKVKVLSIAPLGPSTLPSVMVDLPVNELVVSPVTLLPSCLKVKVLSIAPFGPSAVAFQLPLMSAANALKANSAISAGSHFIQRTPFNSRQYTLGQTGGFVPY